MLNDKALKLDNILNEILKKVIYIIKDNLTLTISMYFVSEVTLKIFCKFITVILRKKRKKNYLFLSNYHFIALKNTIIKLIKKLVTEQIINTIEIYNFLL